MSKRKQEEFSYNLPSKKGRVGVDNGSRTKNNKGSSENLNADEKVTKHLDNAAQTKQKSKKKQKVKKPNFYIDRDILTMHDLAWMCHSFVAKDECQAPNWMVFKKKSEQPEQMVFTRINCTEEQMDDENKQMAFAEKFFGGYCKPVFDEVLDRNVYWEELTHIYIPKQEQLKRFFKTQNDAIKELRRNDDNKLSLLTTIDEMMRLSYPFHGFDEDIFGVAPVVSTKDHYTKVTKESPIFVLDCEMCFTDIKQPELTRVTLIDKFGKIVLDTFVKPANKIVDYVTCFSGVTENALRNCSVTLQDVQEAFRRILPPDAILCGHAIENDLKALRLSHPYCIDTSFAYNMSDQKNAQSSLRNLMYFYFNENIQSSALGHCSYEDAWSSLRLLKLKLENGKSFGSLELGFNYVEWAKKKGFHDHVESFQNGTTKNASKPYVKNLKLPEPREIGKCITCKVSIKSQCFIDKCLCVQKMTQYCCICVGKEIKHGKLAEENRFNFGKFTPSLQEISNRLTIQETLKEYKRPPKVLIAKYLTGAENAEDLTDKNVHVYDMNSYGSLPKFEKALSRSKIASHDLCLLEYNARSLQSSDIENYLRVLHQQIGRNVVFGALLCSPQRAVLFINVKKC